MKATGRQEWNMDKVDIFGLIKLFMKEVFGLTKDKVKEKFNIKLTADMKDTGEMIREKVRVCFLKIIQLSELSIDFNICISIFYFAN